MPGISPAPLPGYEAAMQFERPPGDATRREISPLLKMALELGPLVLFFLANGRGETLMERYSVLAAFGEPIFLATAVFMVAVVISLTVSLALTGRIAIMPLVTGVVVMVFGGLTLFLQDELFIKLKPTIVNVLFGGVLLGGLAFGRSLLGYVFSDAFHLTAEGWRILTLRWGLFFFGLAVLNEIVWRNFSTDFWVAFKVWGIMPITVVFTLIQMPLINRCAAPRPGEAGE